MWKFILAVVVVCIAYFSKPNQASFQSGFEQKVLTQLQSLSNDNLLGELIISKLVENVLWEVCQGKYDDYFVCTTYEIRLGIKKIKYLGVFGQVIPISGENNLKEITAILNK